MYNISITRMSQKLLSKYEDPVNLLTINNSEPVLRFFKKHNFTANHLTLLSFVFGMLSCYLYFLDYKIYAGLCHMISYYFDTIDGPYARKYKITSDIGDILDHTNDIVRHTLIFYLIYKKEPEKIKNNYVLIMLFILTMVQLGCQEKYKGDKEGRVFSHMMILCPGDPNKIIPYAKFFGDGVFALYIALLIMA